MTPAAALCDPPLISDPLSPCHAPLGCSRALPRREEAAGSSLLNLVPEALAPQPPTLRSSLFLSMCLSSPPLSLCISLFVCLSLSNLHLFQSPISLLEPV